MKRQPSARKQLENSRQATAALATALAFQRQPAKATRRRR